MFTRHLLLNSWFILKCFVVDGQGAGFGNLEIIVNGGKVTSHVSTLEPQKKFSANFIPHDSGRHRVDVKFNGEKVPHSPWFVEVIMHQIKLSDLYVCRAVIVLLIAML